MIPAPGDPLLSGRQVGLRPRQIHTITDRFAMANTYLIVGEQLIVVDPWSELNVHLLDKYLEIVLKRALTDIGLVVLTNLHGDQAPALALLRRHSSTVPIAAAAAMQRLVSSRAEMLGVFSPAHWHGSMLPPAFEQQLRFVDTWLEDVEGLPVDRQWRIIASPGHSPDSLCLYNPFTTELLAGDTIISVEQHRVVLRNGSDRQQVEQLRHLLHSLTVHYIYPAHGRPILGEHPLQYLRREW